MSPEGNGKPQAVAKAGAPAQLTNALVENAKEAIESLWKARNYPKMKPQHSARRSSGTYCSWPWV